ncbi:hypothetical protein ILFOPFJJ_06412 [Ensifer psoraleae]|nr:hypothetical protein [Sinorhizobium psoraleae]
MGAAAGTHDVSGHGRARGSLAVMRRMPPQHGQTIGSKRAALVPGLTAFRPAALRRGIGQQSPDDG